MVEVRAIVRRELVDRVVKTVKEAGMPRLTVSRVHAIGAGVDPASVRLSWEEGTEYAEKALVQCICPEERGEMLVELICRAARSGRKGDGIVYVQPVLSVTKIRTGVQGDQALG